MTPCWVARSVAFCCLTRKFARSKEVCSQHWLGGDRPGCPQWSSLYCAFLFGWLAIESVVLPTELAGCWTTTLWVISFCCSSLDLALSEIRSGSRKRGFLTHGCYSAHDLLLPMYPIVLMIVFVFGGNCRCRHSRHGPWLHVRCSPFFPLKRFSSKLTGHVHPTCSFYHPNCQ